MGGEGGGSGSELLGGGAVLVRYCGDNGRVFWEGHVGKRNWCCNKALWGKEGGFFISDLGNRDECLGEALWGKKWVL